MNIVTWYPPGKLPNKYSYLVQYPNSSYYHYKLFEHNACHIATAGALLSLAKHSHCTQFTLRTPDGPLDCTFWEMEQSFPSTLTVSEGGTVRVVGQWQQRERRLKCFSVRTAQKAEESTARKCVKMADACMRRLVQNL